MPSIDQFLNNKFMNAKDLKGKTITGKILECLPESGKGSRGDYTVLAIRLNSHEKLFRVNVTNMKALADVWGKDYTKWAGHSVKITTELVSYQGEMVDGLKIISLGGKK